MGTFAEEFCTFAKGLVKIPDSVGDEEAPFLACGGLTAYGAVKKLFKHGVQPGSPIAIVGAAGGLGHYAVQIAKAFGYVVVGVDVGEDRLKFVESLGADYAVSPEDAPGLRRERVRRRRRPREHRVHRQARGLRPRDPAPATERALRRGRSPRHRGRQPRDQPLPLLLQGSDADLLRRRQRAGDASSSRSRERARSRATSDGPGSSPSC